MAPKWYGKLYIRTPRRLPTLQFRMDDARFRYKLNLFALPYTFLPRYQVVVETDSLHTKSHVRLSNFATIHQPYSLSFAVRW